MDVAYAVAGVDDESVGGQYDGWAADRLGDEICSWAANMTAGDAKWLAMIAEFDRQQGWAQHGSISCANWLQNKVGLDRTAAHEKVRVAHKLEEFPLLARAMSAGVLSYAKVRAITRIATTDNADLLLGIALERSSNQVERYVASFHRCAAAEDDREAKAFAERSLSYRTEDASMVFTLRVPVEAGTAFLTCVERFVNTTEGDIPPTARRADAAIDMAEHAVANIDHDGSTDGQYLVTLHLSPDVFADEQPDRDEAEADVAAGHLGCDRDDTRSSDEGGAATTTTVAGSLRQRRDRNRERRDVCCVAPGDGLAAHPVSVSLKTAERILCDTVLQGYKIGGGDAALLGADKRFPSPKLQRALRLRDAGCMAPGCDRLSWLHSHHITHWTKNGPTIASNLVCLCRFHHRLVHEGGWWITGNANLIGGLTFHRPDGTILPAGQDLIVGHAEPIDIGCTADAVRPCASVHEQLEIIAQTRRIRERFRELGRQRRAMLSCPGTTGGGKSAGATPARWADGVDPFAEFVPAAGGTTRWPWTNSPDQASNAVAPIS